MSEDAGLEDEELKKLSAVKRRRKTVSLTIGSEALSVLDRLCRRTGKNRSRMVEELIFAGAPLIERIMQGGKTAEEHLEEKIEEKEQELPERFMRRMLFEDWKGEAR